MKKVSSWAIILAVVLLVVLMLLRGFFPMFAGTEFGLATWEIIALATAIVVAFTPVYRSIWLDKQLGVNSSNIDEQILDLIKEEKLD